MTVSMTDRLDLLGADANLGVAQTVSSAGYGALQFQRSGVPRWTIGMRETGNNWNDAFYCDVHGDNGVVTSNVFNIDRASGQVNFNATPTVLGGALATASDLGSLVGRLNVIFIEATSGDARAALSAADAMASGATIQLPSGVTRVGSNITLNKPLYIPAGAWLRPAAGVTITLNGWLVSPGIDRMFDLADGGAVVFAPGRAPYARPEWWDSSGRAACLPALKAAETSGADEVRLAKVSYFLGAPCWNVLTPYVRIQGAKRLWAGENTATRIVGQGGDGTVLQLGPDAPPANPQYGNEIADFDVMRDAYPTIPAPGSEVDASCGVKFCFTFSTTATRINVQESTNGYIARGVVNQRFVECDAIRTAAGVAVPGSGPDVFYGYRRDDRWVMFAGGNASVYVIGGNVRTPPNIYLESYGVYANGAFADTFIDGLETTSLYSAIHLIGSKGVSSAGPAVNGDVRINNVVCDQNRRYGVTVQNLEVHGQVTIVGGDFAPDTGVSDAGAFFDNNDGTVIFKNNKLQMFPAPNVPALVVTNSSDVTTRDNIFLDSRYPEEWMNCSGGISSNNIKNPTTAAAPQAGIFVSNCLRMTFQPKMSGPSGAFGAGVNLSDAASQFNTVYTDGINPGCITGGAKVGVNGVIITSEGTANNNRIIGLMN